MRSTTTNDSLLRIVLAFADTPISTPIFHSLADSDLEQEFKASPTSFEIRDIILTLSASDGKELDGDDNESSKDEVPFEHSTTTLRKISTSLHTRSQCRILHPFAQDLHPFYHFSPTLPVWKISYFSNYISGLSLQDIEPVLAMKDFENKEDYSSPVLPSGKYIDHVMR